MVIIISGEDQHAHFRHAALDLADEADAADAGHVQIHQHDIGLNGPQLVQGLLGADGAAHHFKFLIRGEENAQAFQQQALVIHEENLD